MRYIFLLKCLPSVRFGQVVGAGINLMDGEETWPCRTCGAEYIDTLKFPFSNRNPKSCFLLKRSLEEFEPLISRLYTKKESITTRAPGSDITYPAGLWILAAAPWRSQWRTEAVGLSVPRRTTPRPARTTSRCYCRACSASVACLTSSRWCRSYRGHTRWAERNILC